MTDYYLDFSSATDGVGTIGDPFNLLASAETALGGGTPPHTLYIKRGTSQITRGESNPTIYLGSAKDDINFTAYGTGNIPVLNCCWTVYNSDRWTFTDIEFDGTGLTGGSKNYCVNAYGTYLRDSSFTRCKFHDFNNWINIDANSYDILVDDCEGTCIVGGINIEATTTNRAYNITIQDTDIEGLSGANDGISIHCNYGEVKNVGNNILILRCHIHNAFNWDENALDMTASDGTYIIDCDIENAWIPVYMSYYSTNIHFLDNRVTGGTLPASGGVMVISCAGPVYLYNNTITSASGIVGVVRIIDGSDGVVSHHPDGIYFFNNTIMYNGGTYCIDIADSAVDPGLGVIELRYNIITSRTSAMANAIQFRSSSYKYNNANFLSLGNVIYDPAHDAHFQDTDGAITWATWTATYTEESKNDPLLVDRTSATWADWKLSSTSSPAYGNSLSVAGTYYDLTAGSVAGTINTQDQDGTSTREDIGAWEYVGGGPSPSIVKRFGGLRGFGGTNDFGR